MEAGANDQAEGEASEDGGEKEPGDGPGALRKGGRIGNFVSSQVWDGVEFCGHEGEGLRCIGGFRKEESIGEAIVWREGSALGTGVERSASGGIRARFEEKDDVGDAAEVAVVTGAVVRC